MWKSRHCQRLDIARKGNLNSRPNIKLNRKIIPGILSKSVLSTRRCDNSTNECTVYTSQPFSRQWCHQYYAIIRSWKYSLTYKKNSVLTAHLVQYTDNILRIPPLCTQLPRSTHAQRNTSKGIVPPIRRRTIVSWNICPATSTNGTHR